MSRTFYCILLSLLIVVLFQPYPACAEGKSRYVTLQHNGDAQLLRDFNREVSLTRKLRYYLDKKKTVTIEDEVLAKLDIIIEKTETVLDMFPANLHITVVLLPTSRDVAAMYKQKYGKRADHIAYYSLKEKTIYVSVNDVSLRVITHEIGHAIVDHYFTVRPPYNMHELMAQFAEQHIDD